MYEAFVHLLKKHDLKVTPQRLEILNFLASHPVHPTADEIYKTLKHNNPSLSKTTVYNSIDVLNKHDLITILTISGKEQRYDFTHTPHQHFLCTRCGRIIDIHIKCPQLGKVIDGGHKIEEVHGYFKGICKICAQKQKEKNI